MTSLNNTQKAIDDIRRSIMLNPKDAGAWRCLSDIIRRRNKAEAEDYIVIAGLIERQAFDSLATHIPKHSDLFKDWKNQLREKIKEDIKSTQHELQIEFMAYDNIVQKSTSENSSIGKKYCNESAAVRYSIIDTLRRLDAFQNNVLALIKRDDTAFLSVEKWYFETKREEYISKVQEFRSRLGELNHRYATKSHVGDSEESTLENKLWQHRTSQGIGAPLCVAASATLGGVGVSAYLYGGNLSGILFFAEALGAVASLATAACVLGSKDVRLRIKNYFTKIKGASEK